MKKFFFLCCFLPLCAFADQKSELLDMIKAVEKSCGSKYTDQFLHGDSNHSQLYCLSAFEFQCLNKLDSVKVNCDTLTQLGDLHKCPACEQQAAQQKK